MKDAILDFLWAVSNIAIIAAAWKYTAADHRNDVWFRRRLGFKTVRGMMVEEPGEPPRFEPEFERRPK